MICDQDCHKTINLNFIFLNKSKKVEEKSLFLVLLKLPGIGIFEILCNIHFDFFFKVQTGTAKRAETAAWKQINIIFRKNFVAVLIFLWHFFLSVFSMWLNHLKSTWLHGSFLDIPVFDQVHTTCIWNRGCNQET